MAAFGHLALLALSVIGLGAAAVRLASLAAPRGLERVVAAAPLAVAAAVTESLALGLLALGTTPIALAAVTFVLWLSARRALPPPEVRLADEIADAWARAGTGPRLAVGALAALALLLVSSFLRRPHLGLDGLHYHLPEAIEWVYDGRPGSLHRYVDEIPVESYPVTDEVVISWLLGLARCFVPVQPWILAMAAQLGAASWLGLRRLDCDRVPSGLGVAALLLVPQLAFQLNGPSTDVSSLAWIASAAGLCCAARDRPLLLAPAVVAAGLSVGTKTTASPLAALVCGWALWHHRHSLPRLRGGLLIAALIAGIVGGSWYVRNFVMHGSPLWPLLATPWGDPPPVVVTGYNQRFVDRPAETLVVLASRFGRLMLPGAILVTGGLVAAVARPRRRVLVASLVTAASLFLWSIAPFTGVTQEPIGAGAVASTTRYLLPTVAAAVVAVVLTASGSGAASILFRALLVLAVTAGLLTMVWGAQGYPRAPITMAAAAAGALAALVIPIERLARCFARVPPLPAAITVSVVLALALSPAADGYVKRHSTVAPDSSGAMVAWAAGQPAFEIGRDRISITRRLIASLAGDRFQHALELVPSREPCPALASRADGGWVVVRRAQPSDLEGLDDPLARGCFAGVRPLYEDHAFAVYGPPDR